MKVITVPFALLLLLAAASAGETQESQPAIEGFAFTPTKVKYGDTLQYKFSYKNLPGGGLATVRDAEMWVDWQRPTDRPVRSRYVPSQEELAQHIAESGVFESRVLTWRPPERNAPYGGIDVKYTLRLKLPNGKWLAAAATFRFEE